LIKLFIANISVIKLPVLAEQAIANW